MSNAEKVQAEAAELYPEPRAHVKVEYDSRRIRQGERSAFIEGRTVTTRQLEAAAEGLMSTEWDWRNIGPHQHTSTHYSADCPLCRPDYGDNPRRITRAVLEAAGLIVEGDDE